VVLVVIALAGLLLPARAAEDDKPAKKMELRVTFERDLEPGTKLGDVLDFLKDRYEFTWQVDLQAFKSAAVKNINDFEISLPKLKDVRLGTVLQLLLKKVDAVYVLENGIVNIVPKPKENKKTVTITPLETKIEKALRKKLSDTNVTLKHGIGANTPLKDALTFLSDRYGVNICVDARRFQK
jgi:hypothetical protein